MKALITHINPHLDDISAIWLFKKLNPDYVYAPVEFISASRDAAQHDMDQERIYLGTGGGRFDEHKGDLEDCAVSLVWKYIKAQNREPKDQVTVKALDQLVEWNRLIDLGKGTTEDFGPFSVQAFIRSKESTQEGSLKSLQLGEEILDRILELLKQKVGAEVDWERRKVFQTKFGNSFAVISSVVDRTFCREKGGDLFLMYDTKFKSAQFFTPSFEIDLEPIYKKVVELEPNAGWFLHQSHHMVICGSASSPNQHTELPFDKLIEVAKEV